MICGSGKLTCANVETGPLALSWRCQHWWSGDHSSTASFMTETPKWLAKQQGEPRSANKKAKKGQSVAVASSPVPMWNNRPQIGNWSTDCFASHFVVFVMKLAVEEWSPLHQRWHLKLRTSGHISTLAQVSLPLPQIGTSLPSWLPIWVFLIVSLATLSFLS